MSQQDIGCIRITLLRPPPHLMNVLQQHPVAVFFLKKSPVVLGRRRFPMAQMVVADDEIAPLCQIGSKAVIPLNIFDHAVRDL